MLLVIYQKFFAKELLDEYHLNIVRAVWTEEIVEAYALKMAEIEEQEAK